MNMKKRLPALLLALCVTLTLLPVTALAESADSYGARAAVTTTVDGYGNVDVAGYSVPAKLFYYTYYTSGTPDKEYRFRGGAFNSNSAENPVKAYAPAVSLVVPMICVWDYEKPLGAELPGNITVADGIAVGAANDHSDSWLITYLPTDFLPTYADRAAFAELVLPMSLQRIGVSAVQNCAQLASVSFYDLNNSRLERIDENAFYNCPRLSAVELPDTLTTIGDDAFANCPSLKTVTVPASVTDIRSHALGYTTQDGNSYAKVPGFTVRGYRGSAAQTYAQRCGFTFLALDGTEAENWQGTGVIALDNFEKMPQAAYMPGQFTDVNEDAWYGANGQKAVQTAYELRIVNGKSKSAFDPNGNVLLSEALKMAAVVRDIYLGGNGVFTAQSWEQWYEPYVDYCIDEGIIGSGDFSGSYARPATRAEMAYIFANALPVSELRTVNDITALPDVTAQTPYREQILTMYRCGALQGNDAYGTFTPNANITRAAAAAIISRIALRDKRLTFALETKQETSVGVYTPDMWVRDAETLEKVYKERVWGLYSEMRIRMEYELATEMINSDCFQEWVPFAVDVQIEYNSDDDRVMVFTFSNYELSFEVDALMANGAAQTRASANAVYYLSRLDEVLASLKLSGKSEREKLLAIHDWMVAHIAYDRSFADASYTFYGPLDNGKAVCQGYAELFYYLARCAGIECYTVTGMASSGAGRTDWEGHAWNVVYLTGDETAYFIDVTYDDPIPDTTTGRHDYFMVSEKKLSADHQW